MQRRILAAALALYSWSLFGDWSPAEFIPDGMTGPVNYDVTLAFNTTDQTLSAAWSNDSMGDQEPLSSIRSGSVWSLLVIPSGGSSNVKRNLTQVYNPVSNRILAAWIDALDDRWFSLFDGASWSAGSSIMGFTSTTNSNMGLAFNSASNLIYGAWVDGMIGVPAAAVYNGVAWMGTTLLGGSPVAFDVNLSYNSMDNLVIAAWGEMTSVIPKTAIYDGMSWTLLAIPQGMSAGVQHNVSLAYDPLSNQMFAAWADSATKAPYYAVYASGSWSTAAQIPAPPSGAFEDVILAFSTSTGQMFAAWADGTTNAPMYATYNGASWTTGSIDLGVSDGAAYNVYLASGGGNAFYAAWSNLADGAPVWSVFTLNPTVIDEPPNFRRPYNRRVSGVIDF